MEIPDNIGFPEVYSAELAGPGYQQFINYIANPEVFQSFFAQFRGKYL